MKQQLMLLGDTVARQVHEEVPDNTPNDLMEFFILLIVGMIIVFAVVMFFVGMVQKAKRRNDGLAQKSKLLEMYAAEEKAREEAEAKKLQEEQDKNKE